MAYNSNTPNANDRISSTQQPIKDNFVSIETAFELNHGAFDGPDEGKHEFITHVQQAGDPGAPGATEINLYTKTSSESGGARPELFIQRSAGTPFQFTGSENATTGWSILPSGLLMRWGTATRTGSAGGVILFASGAFPGFATVFRIFAQPVKLVAPFDKFITVRDNSTAASFTVHAWRYNTSVAVTDTTVVFDWFALGI